MTGEQAMQTLLDTSGVRRAMRYQLGDVVKLLGTTKQNLASLRHAGTLVPVRVSQRTAHYTHEQLVAYLDRLNRRG